MPITKATASSIAPAAKGDLVVGSATNDASVLAVGSANQVLTVDSSTSTGLKWAAPSAPTFVGAMAIANAIQSINNATETAIALAGTDVFDTDSIHNPSTNNTRMTIPSGQGGYYLVNAACPMEDIGTSGNVRLLIRANGSSNRFSGFFGACDGVVGNTVSGIVNLVAGDYVEMLIYQNGGSTINTAHDPSGNHVMLTISKVG